jgi:hypothetical protein
MAGRSPLTLRPKSAIAHAEKTLAREFRLVIGLAAATLMFATTARADCIAECKAGFDVCMHNCGGQSGCLATCSRGHEGCMRRCQGRSMNLAGRRQLASLEPRCVRDGTCSPLQKPFQGIRVATGSECPATSGRYCTDEFPYCCYAPAAQTYYCAVDVSHCTRS